jgi:hypothetical protein
MRDWAADLNAVGVVCRGPLTHGHVPIRALEKLLSKLQPSGFLLGTEVEAPVYGQYDLEKGAAALRQLTLKQLQEGHPHVPTLGFPPLEMTTMELHKALATLYEEAPCARWAEWRLDMPLSPRLDGYKGCSMGLRFLQHYVDSNSAQQ